MATLIAIGFLGGGRLSAQADASTGAPPPPISLPPGSVFEGRASWYGEAFEGRRTASGEIFSKEGLTAAHRSLPFGTLLLVTDKASGASVVVRVNDRGPFAADRVIDLSEAAARLIGLVPEGTGVVSCLVLRPEEAAAFGPPPTTEQGSAANSLPSQQGRSCRIQVASYRDAANAAATIERLRLSGIAAVLERAGGYSRVVIASVPEAEAAALSERLHSLGYRSLLMTWTP